MNLPVIRFLALMAPLIFFHQFIAAQAAANDSSFYQAAISNALVAYQQSAREQSRLINGRQYKPYSFTFVKGTPYFQSGQYAKGTIHYEGVFYDSVFLLHDEVKDMLMLDAGVRIEMINDRVKEFSIGEHHFIRLARDTVNNVFGEGYYEILYNGGIEILKREVKELKEALSVTEGYQAEVVVKTFYYLKKAGRYYRIKRKGELLDILRDKRSQIEQFMKSNNLNFKKDTQNTVTKVAAFYDQLTK